MILSKEQIITSKTEFQIPHLLRYFGSFPQNSTYAISSSRKSNPLSLTSITSKAIKIAHNNVTKAICCLKRSIGTTAESYAILDFKDPPTVITKATVFMATLNKYLNVHVITWDGQVG